MKLNLIRVYLEFCRKEMVPRVATKCVAIVALKPKENDESSVANASFIGVVSFNVKNVIVTSKSAHANELDG